jgi:hypothetical protein
VQLKKPTPVAKTAAAGTAAFTISVRYNGKEQNTPLPLTPTMARHLALEASVRNQRISELATDLLQSVTEKGLFDEVLKG